MGKHPYGHIWIQHGFSVRNGTPRVLSWVRVKMTIHSSGIVRVHSRWKLKSEEQLVAVSRASKRHGALLVSGYFRFCIISNTRFDPTCVSRVMWSIDINYSISKTAMRVVSLTATYCCLCLAWVKQIFWYISNSSIMKSKVINLCDCTLSDNIGLIMHVQISRYSFIWTESQALCI